MDPKEYLSPAQLEFTRNLKTKRDVIKHDPPPKLTPREVRLWNYFNFYQDIFYPIERWPKYLAEMVLLDHKNNQNRYKLFLFLVYNGLAVWDAADFIMIRDVSEYGDIIIGEYDASARRQIFQMAAQYYDGSMLNNMKPVMNMYLGAVSTHNKDVARDLYANK